MATQEQEVSVLFVAHERDPEALRALIQDQVQPGDEPWSVQIQIGPAYGNATVTFRVDEPDFDSAAQRVHDTRLPNWRDGAPEEFDQWVILDDRPVAQPDGWWLGQWGTR